MKKKAIMFTDDQYKILVKLLFYGEWILNANKSEAEDMDEEAEDLMTYIFNKKEDFNLKDWFRDLEYGEELKERVIMLLLDKVFEYNEDTFWFYLTKKMADRDIGNISEGKRGRKVDPDKIDDLKYKFVEKYEKAFEGRDIGKLYLKED